MIKSIKIAIAEPSVVISRGLSTILKKIHGFHTDIFEISDFEALKKVSISQIPDILLINPTFLFVQGIQNFKKQYINNKTKFIALQTSLFSSFIIREFDEVITIFDDEEKIKQTITDLFELPDREQEINALSQREKEVVSEVVKGLTNKQIADKLYLSVHTVTTHRRNIAAKLQIHSTAGLTIYAISNKLI
ncbi:MAG: response regulator transcription factor [Prevotellaceae bacterium]|jgi:DNA-binding CsgD family transcriptional regulator|nr:response regulator transcription factor [Prevotellaceae bacterium]